MPLRPGELSMTINCRAGKVSGRSGPRPVVPLDGAGIPDPLTLNGAPLSVLDLAPIPDGGSAGEALRATTELARRTESLGFTRFWVAEHHGMPGIASSSPPVLIGHIADATETIRVGSRGVMLPNHTSLVVAEQFGMLEALHPGRIDLGIGRAPGTDQATAQALRHRAAEDPRPDDFPRQLTDLVGFFTGEWPANHPYRHAPPTPRARPPPPPPLSPPTRSPP